MGALGSRLALIIPFICDLFLLRLELQGTFLCINLFGVFDFTTSLSSILSLQHCTVMVVKFDDGDINSPHCVPCLACLVSTQRHTPTMLQSRSSGRWAFLPLFQTRLGVAIGLGCLQSVTDAQTPFNSTGRWLNFFRCSTVTVTVMVMVMVIQCFLSTVYLYLVSWIKYGATGKVNNCT